MFHILWCQHIYMSIFSENLFRKHMIDKNNLIEKNCIRNKIPIVVEIFKISV
jgi:hypothetical protein